MRQFLALALPDELLASLARLQAELRVRCAGWRFLRADGLHVTLRFLGEVDAELDRGARPRWRQAIGAIGAFEATVEGVGSFPDRGRPRLLWAGVRETGSSGRLGALAAALERTARDLGFPAEGRAFRSHVTLARARGPGAAVRPGDTGFGPSGSFPVRRVTLYRSRLAGDGARYTALERFPLAEGS